ERDKHLGHAQRRAVATTQRDEIGVFDVPLQPFVVDSATCSTHPVKRNVTVTYVIRTLVRRCDSQARPGLEPLALLCPVPYSRSRTSPYNSVRAWSAPSCGITRPGMLGGGYGCGPAERRRSQGAAP